MKAMTVYQLADLGILFLLQSLPQTPKTLDRRFPNSIS
jgi:hypothetical protein